MTKAKHFEKLLEGMKRIPDNANRYKHQEWEDDVLSWPASHMLVTAEGKEKRFGSDVCFGSLNRLDQPIDCLGHWFLYCLHPDVDLFLEWITGPDYPFKFVLDAQDTSLVRDIEYIKEYGFVYDNLDIPGNWLMAHMILTRAPVEYYNNVTLWAQFYRKGLHPTVAWFTAFMFPFGHHPQNPLSLGSVPIMWVYSGHTSFNDRITMDDFKRVLNQTPVEKNALDRDWFRSGKGYSDVGNKNVYGVFCEEPFHCYTSGKFHTFLKSLISYEVEETVKGFGGRTRKVDKVHDDFIERLKEWQDVELFGKSKPKAKSTTGVRRKRKAALV